MAFLPEQAAARREPCAGAGGLGSGEPGTSGLAGTWGAGGGLVWPGHQDAVGPRQVLPTPRLGFPSYRRGSRRLPLSAPPSGPGPEVWNKSPLSAAPGKTGCISRSLGGRPGELIRLAEGDALNPTPGDDLWAWLRWRRPVASLRGGGASAEMGTAGVIYGPSTQPPTHHWPKPRAARPAQLCLDAGGGREVPAPSRHLPRSPGIWLQEGVSTATWGLPRARAGRWAG